MDAIDYCVDKVAMPGTPGYYAVLLQAPPARAALLALRALERELSEVVELCTDQSVAQHKLMYWQQELQASNASPPHPVTRALQQHAGDVLDSDARARLLAGTAQRISIAQVRDEAETDSISAATAGTIASACAQVAGGNAEAAVAIAIAAERLRLLTMPRRAGLPAHCGIALSTLAACAITPGQIDSGQDHAALRRLRASLLDQALRAAQHAERLLEERRGYLATWLRITRCLLAANHKNDYAGSGRLTRVAPLRLLWHAWRARPRSAPERGRCEFHH